MKTTTLTLPTHRFIDTAPLRSRYDVLTEAVLAFVMAGRLLHALKASRKIVRLIQTLTTLEAQNVQLKRKLDMLSHKPWRDRVLRDLGGIRKLKLWEAAYERRLARRLAPVKPLKPQGPSWLYTPERMAESERLKARARDCMRAGHNPLVMRDRCKVDFEGEFRLAPLPRGERGPWQIKVYTENSITEYDWNPMPFAKQRGFDPAMVWPVEFYAAMAIKAEILEGREDKNAHPSTLCSRNSRSEYTESPKATPPNTGDPVSDVWCPNPSPGTREVVQERDEWREDGLFCALHPLRDVLSPKVWNDIFTPLPQEARFACS